MHDTVPQIRKVIQAIVFAVGNVLASFFGARSRATACVLSGRLGLDGTATRLRIGYRPFFVLLVQIVPPLSPERSA